MGGRTAPSEMASAIETIKQGALLVRDLGDGGDVLDDAEEVGRLDEHAGGLIRDGGFECFEIDAAVFAVGKHLLVDVLVLRVSGEHFAVFGVDGLGN